MKTYDERLQSIYTKIEKKKAAARRRNICIAGLACCLVLGAGVCLFTPYDKTPPQYEEYADNEYHKVIQSIGAFTYRPSIYDNLFDELFPSKDFLTGGSSQNPQAPMAPGTNNATSADFGEGGSYIETTDNQVTGVIEGDIIKRSDKHIYYLRGNILFVYSIAQEKSTELGYITITPDSEYQTYSAYPTEMYLSADCRTVTLISSCYDRNSMEKMVVITSIDVSNPANMQVRQRQYLSGDILSSRMTDGNLLIISRYSPARSKIDFSNPDTYIPRYGATDHMEHIAADDIVCPDALNSLHYTVVCKIDTNTLDIADTKAFLSYSNEVYVSKENIYVSRKYTENIRENSSGNTSDRWEEPSLAITKTEIHVLNYSSEDFKLVGSVTVSGSIKDQYSMDEYTYPNGQVILRVATSESYGVASLYCIDLADMSIAASVEDFAPQGENVQSVRFDGTNAYICTAKVIVLTDPVYVFDLSDLSNITSKDTGTIQGYSSSLVNFGDYLLGIGYGDSASTLKLEIYAETSDALTSLAVYEMPDCSFSEEYKSYLIDRDNLRVGLGFDQWYTNASGESQFQNGYLLLQFDGYDLIPILEVTLHGDNDNKRAVIIDNHIYLFGDETTEFGFLVQKL